MVDLEAASEKCSVKNFFIKVTVKERFFKKIAAF